MTFIKFGIGGYDLFREYIHRNLFVGFLHALFFPIAAVGFFSGLYGLAMRLGINEFTIYNGLHGLLLVIVSTMMTSYVMFAPWLGIATLSFHYVLIIIILRSFHNRYQEAKAREINSIYTLQNENETTRLRKNGTSLFFVGLCTVLGSIFVMEVVGHWLIEGKGSDVSQFFNSVTHTPMYGIKSMIEISKIVYNKLR